MICHLPSAPLNSHAKFILTFAPQSATSWFQHIREISRKYSLPDPIHLLLYPPSKISYKKEVKLRVLDYWQQVLRKEASSLSSIKMLRTEYYSLLRPHPLWSASAGNPYETSKSIVVASMMSGRYKSDYMCRHWTPGNKCGQCLYPTCRDTNPPILGTLEHLLVYCPFHETIRQRLFVMFMDKAAPIPELYKFIRDIISNPPKVFQFLMEPLAFPLIRKMLSSQDVQAMVYYMTRTFAFCIHRERMISLGKWPIFK